MRRGYKLWRLVGAKSGYVHHFQISGDNSIDHENVDKSVGNSGLVVIELSKILPKGTSIFFDNYFASPLLALRLKENGYDSTMTLSGNRKAGADKHMLTEKELMKKGRGTFDYVSANGVQVCQWYDNKIVTVASTEFSVHPTDTVKRYHGQHKKKLNVQRPFCIAQYNRGMGGRDLCDQYLATYRSELKSGRWYRKMSYFFSDLCCSQAFSLYKVDHAKDLSRYQVST